MTGAAEFRPRGQHVAIAVMLRRVHRLRDGRSLEHLTEVDVTLRTPPSGPERAQTLGKCDRVRRQPKCSAADAVPEIAGGGISHVDDVLIGWRDQLRSRLHS